MLERAKRASHIDPPASSYAIMRRVHPYRGENPEPGKDVHGELDPWPGIREQAGPILLKKSEYRLGPIFSAPWARFSDADAGDLVIRLKLNGASSKSICGGS